MTRNELYLALTEALAAAKPRGCALYGPSPVHLEQWRADCGHIATAMSAHHKTFDRARFLKDCGVQS